MTAWQVEDLCGGWDALLQHSSRDSLSEALRLCVEVVLFAFVVVSDVFWICDLCFRARIHRSSDLRGLGFIWAPAGVTRVLDLAKGYLLGKTWKRMVDIPNITVYSKRMQSKMRDLCLL